MSAERSPVLRVKVHEDGRFAVRGIEAPWLIVTRCGWFTDIYDERDAERSEVRVSVTVVAPSGEMSVWTGRARISTSSWVDDSLRDCLRYDPPHSGATFPRDYRMTIDWVSSQYSGIPVITVHMVSDK